MASFFTPSLGTVQACNTSAAVTIIRFNLTLYVPCIMFQCVDKPTRCEYSRCVDVHPRNGCTRLNEHTNALYSS